MIKNIIFTLLLSFLLLCASLNANAIVSEVATVQFFPDNLFEMHPYSVSVKAEIASKVFQIRLYHSSSVAPFLHDKLPNDQPNCHYEGYVAGYEYSDAAFSLCSPDDVSGLISFNGLAFVTMNACAVREKCKHGVEYNVTSYGSLNAMPEQPTHQTSQHFLLQRARRDVYAAPYSPLLGEPPKLKTLGENSETLYIRLLLASDVLQFSNNNNIQWQTERRAMQIANVAALLMRPLNIVLYVMEHRILKSDEPNGYNTSIMLSQIQKYRAQSVDSVRNDIDVVHVLTSAKITDAQTGATEDFDLLGQAYISGICSKFAVSFSADLINSVVQVGATMAHELGHLLGVGHDKQNCTCPFLKLVDTDSEKKTVIVNSSDCIMLAAKGVGGDQPFAWSNCSLQIIKDNRKRIAPICLRQKPVLAARRALCGDGIVQDDEQCDCGSQDAVDPWSDVMGSVTKINFAPCSLDCCDMNTCRFSRANVSCATGSCCDLDLCQLKPKYTECRKASSDCDLPEYCSGRSEYCPRDLHKATGYQCSPDKDSDAKTGVCFAGQCNSRTSQCRQLWGSTASEARPSCYTENKRGLEDSNCGHQRVVIQDNGEIKDAKLIKKCPTDEDSYCGTLKCDVGNTTRPIIFMQTLLSDNNNKCAWALASMLPDFGMVLNGTKCRPPGYPVDAVGICLNFRCIALNDSDSVISATFEAEGLGPEYRRLPPTAIPLTAISSSCNCIPQRCFCNSVGSRHCLPGWEPPLCESSGCGGSFESNSAGLCSPLDDSGSASGAVIAGAVIGSILGVAVIVVAIIMIVGRRRLAEMWYSSRLYVEVEHLRDRLRPSSSSTPAAAAAAGNRSELRRAQNGSIRRSLRGPPGPAPITTVSSGNGWDRNGHGAHGQIKIPSPPVGHESIDLEIRRPQSGNAVVNINRIGASPTLNKRVGSAPADRQTAAARIPQRPPPPRAALARPTEAPPPPPKAIGALSYDDDDQLPISVADARLRFGATTMAKPLPTFKPQNDVAHAASRTPPQESVTGQWFNNVLRRNNSQLRNQDDSPVMQRQPMLNATTTTNNNHNQPGNESPFGRPTLQRRPSFGSSGAMHKVTPQS